MFLLAAEVIAEHPFEPVAQEKIQAAKKQLEKVREAAVGDIAQWGKP